MNRDEILTPKDVEAEYQIPERQLQQLRYLGRGPAFHRLGRHVRYKRSDLDAWLQAGRVEPQGAA